MVKPVNNAGCVLTGSCRDSLKSEKPEPSDLQGLKSGSEFSRDDCISAGSGM
ncbi:hypothetical protein RKLH11_3538 [Rhodobacteraceae bacterium KLH11]|nr:hypothetical protein RKLH11_3538 [Rhodobacteraceae bacterium KLH11]